MSLPVLLPENSAPSTTGQTLTYWSPLAASDQAFVVAYIENGYSLPDACASLEISRAEGAKRLKNVAIRKAIGEVQSELDGLDFMNDLWVRAQLLRLYPMAMGDEPVPFISPAGQEAEGRKFDGNLAMKIIEYVAPKTQKAPSVNININNIGRLSDADLEKIAAQGAGRVVSEQ